MIENIYCNWYDFIPYLNTLQLTNTVYYRSGGCAIGSLGTGTAISTVTYRNIYTWSANQEMMIKSNGGDGYVQDIVFENFIGHGNAYSLNVDQYWSSISPIAGNGITLSGLTFTVRLPSSAIFSHYPSSTAAPGFQSSQSKGWKELPYIPGASRAV